MRSNKLSPTGQIGIHPTLPRRTKKLKPIKINDLDIGSEFRDDVESKRYDDNYSSDVQGGMTKQ